MKRPRRQAGLGGAARVAPVFAALGDRTRLGILNRLSHHGPQNTARLTSDVNISRQAVTKHLLALQKAQIIQSKRSGRERVWTLQPNRLEDLNNYIQQISSEWDAALGRLRAMVETR